MYKKQLNNNIIACFYQSLSGETTALISHNSSANMHASN